ncbi:hypothetical protein [Salinifilum ghardaiensis]
MKLMHRWYSVAGRPTLRELAAAIRADHDHEGTASEETIRRILKGLTVPRWPTVKAVLEELCRRNGQSLNDPNNPRDPLGPTCLQVLHPVWDAAFVEANSPSEPPREFSDEPPF